MQVQTGEAPKRGRGRPRKVETFNKLDNWRAEEALKKAKGDPLVALAIKTLPDGTQIPKGLDKVTEKHFVMLIKDFSELGIDVKTYKLVTVQLAKHYAMEEMCEKELKRIGGIAYLTSKDEKSVLWREHPAAKYLHATRTLILNTLKSLGLTPTSNGAGPRFQKDEESSPFAQFQ